MPAYKGGFLVWLSHSFLIDWAYIPNSVEEKPMATQEEREICKAPPGKFQIVHVDPRDHWPTREGAPKTLEEVGFEFDLSRERIRQIEDGALKKLKEYLAAHHPEVILFEKRRLLDY